MFPCADLVLTRGRQHRPQRQGKLRTDTAESQTPEHVSKFQAREPGEPNNICGEMAPQRGFKTDRWFHVSDAKDQMDVVRQSDGSVVSTKSANKDATEASAEWMEKRDPAKRNADQANPPQAQNWDKVGKSGLERVREAARKDGKMKFVSLLHHADVDALRRSFYQLKKTAVVGIDGGEIDRPPWSDTPGKLPGKAIA